MLADDLKVKIKKHCCPCCDFRTLDHRNWLQICEVCYWQDDGQDDEDEHVVGTWNYGLSLQQARHNFVRFGASCKKYLHAVRSPTMEERNQQDADFAFFLKEG